LGLRFRREGGGEGGEKGGTRNLGLAFVDALGGGERSYFSPVKKTGRRGRGRGEEKRGDSFNSFKSFYVAFFPPVEDGVVEKKEKKKGKKGKGHISLPYGGALVATAAEELRWKKRREEERLSLGGEKEKLSPPPPFFLFPSLSPSL